jgi:hypothetical protein
MVDFATRDRIPSQQLLEERSHPNVGAESEKDGGECRKRKWMRRSRGRDKKDLNDEFDDL